MSTILTPTRPATPTFHADRSLPCRRPDVDPEIFYAEPGAAGNRQRVEAKRLCRGCRHRWDCLEWAIDSGELSFGIYGGATATERRAIVESRTKAGARPVPPAKAASPFGWGWSTRPDPERLRSLFHIARIYVDADGVLTKARMCQQYNVTRGKFAEAVAVVRWAPDQVGDVCEGWVPFESAYRYAQRVRKWVEASGIGREH